MSIKINDMVGLGIAGNFTGHLEQAGESRDFVDVTTEETHAPKGLFPFYLPHHPSSHLSRFPLSAVAISKPDDASNLQIEPEVALVCDISYKDSKVESITPKLFCAFNDCSIRKEGAKKISEKKNWGEHSKGISPHMLPIDSFEKGGILDNYRLASFLKRNGRIIEYGIDSKVSEYNYFHGELISWIIDKVNVQADAGPLECLSKLLAECNYPTQAIITIGATRYTEHGETTYLNSKDEIYVILYPSQRYSHNDIIDMVANGTYQAHDISSLHQIVL